MKNDRRTRCNNAHTHTVTISQQEYAELIAASTMLDMVDAIYQRTSDYSLHAALAPFFTPAPAKEEKHE